MIRKVELGHPFINTQIERKAKLVLDKMDYKKNGTITVKIKCLRFWV